MFVKLNMSLMEPNTQIVMYLYRKGNGIIPSFNRVYGATEKIVVIPANFSYLAKFNIKRSEIAALDKPSQRCDSSLDEPSISKCVEEIFVENVLNCSHRRLMSNLRLGVCDDRILGSSKQNDSYSIFNKLNEMDEREIFEITGCMPGCSKSKFEITTRYENNKHDNGKNVADLRFVYPQGEYDLVEEYYIYNWSSFIADVGGYLGLLLGYSVLSMYQTITQWLVDTKQSWQNMKLNQLCAAKST